MADRPVRRPSQRVSPNAAPTRDEAGALQAAEHGGEAVAGDVHHPLAGAQARLNGRLNPAPVGGMVFFLKGVPDGGVQ
jgi:hypothetical protein